jgi:hypothetical protein
LAGPGRIHRWLVEATERGGSQRALYTAETTLSRRGLLTRADRRARELGELGVRAGDVVALALGNVADYFVALMAISKLGAIVIPVDPANGDRRLQAVMRRLPVRMVIRRQRGLDGAPLHYPEGYTLRSRRQLAGTLVALDVLEPPGSLPRPSPETELIVEAVGDDGVERDVHRNGQHLEAIGRAARRALELEAGTRLLCVQALTVPGFFDPVVLGWLASDAQLVVTGGPGLDSVLPLAQGGERLVAVDTTHNFLALARALTVTSRSIELLPVLPGLSPSPVSARAFRERFGHGPRELLQIEEVGIVAWRQLGRDGGFSLADGIEPITEQDSGQLCVVSPQAGRVHPAAHEGATGSRGPAGAIRTGWCATLGRDATVREIAGRCDALVRLEGRRAGLRTIAQAMQAHRRIVWAQARVDVDLLGEPVLGLRYVATGETELEDLEEHAVAELEPYMVPRVFERLAAVPEPSSDASAADSSLSGAKR